MKKILSIISIGILLLSGLGAGASLLQKTSVKQTGMSDEYDMVIIAPEMFSDDLQPLIDHKNSIGIQTILETTEDIYSMYDGRDEAEQIKYFIYESAKNHSIQYVLLVGDVEIIPIRKTEVNHIWPSGNIIQVDDVITDLYYADIYDSEGKFSSWDSNNDNIFSDFSLYNFGENPQDIKVVDDVDLYPDIGVGRIPCTTVEELEIVVNKIISYETQVNDDWFHNIILAAQTNQGEMIADLIADMFPDFTAVKLYESTGNLNAHSINRAINDGAGFFITCAHGRHMAFANYYKSFVNGLYNNNKLPIVMFGGCLNAQLDASLHELLKEFGLNKTENFLQFFKIDTKKLLSCIAWDFLRYADGGSIASVGMTRKGTISSEDPLGEFAGLFASKFFKSYESGIILSEMYNHAITSFIDESWKDYVTLQMFILLGDPSLKIGGYK